MKTKMFIPVLVITCLSMQVIAQNNLLPTEQQQKGMQEYDNPGSQTYQQAPSFVLMVNPELSLEDQSKDSEGRRQLLNEAGFPTFDQYAGWLAGSSLQDKILQYKAKKALYEQHPLFRSLQQHASWLILTKANLLGTNQTEDILYFTWELIASRYHGMVVLETCLLKLQEAKLDTRQMTKKIVEYYEADKAWAREKETIMKRPEKMEEPTNPILLKGFENLKQNEAAYERIASMVSPGTGIAKS